MDILATIKDFSFEERDLLNLVVSSFPPQKVAFLHFVFYTPTFDSGLNFDDRGNVLLKKAYSL